MTTEFLLLSPKCWSLPAHPSRDSECTQIKCLGQMLDPILIWQHPLPYHCTTDARKQAYCQALPRTEVLPQCLLQAALPWLGDTIEPLGLISSTWSKTETRRDRKGSPQCLALLPWPLLPRFPSTFAYYFFQPFMASISKQDLEALWGRLGRKWLTEKVRVSREAIKQMKRIWCIETRGQENSFF